MCQKNIYLQNLELKHSLALSLTLFLLLSCRSVGTQHKWKALQMSVQNRIKKQKNNNETSCNAASLIYIQYIYAICTYLVMFCFGKHSYCFDIHLCFIAEKCIQTLFYSLFHIFLLFFFSPVVMVVPYRILAFHLRT